MGLALEVGILADLKDADEEGYEHFREQFALLNELLAENRMPAHSEPEEIPVFSCDMYGYSGLHYLRRIAAHLLVNRSMPDPCLGRPNDDPVMDECYDEIASMQDTRSSDWRRFDHLLCHSDAEGFYVPVAFDEVLFDFNERGLAGGQLGSTTRLLAECNELANALQLPTNLDLKDKAIFDATQNQGRSSGWQRYGIESYACIHLIHAARHSLKHGAAIVFV